MSMKKYRIKNYYDAGYILQERYWVFFWFTIRRYSDMTAYLVAPVRIFETIESAKDCIKHIIESEEKLKKAKYTEYL